MQNLSPVSPGVFQQNFLETNENLQNHLQGMVYHLPPNYWIMGNQMAYHGHTVSTNKLCISKISGKLMVNTNQQVCGFIPTISVAWIFSSSQPLRVLPLRVSVASLLDLTWGTGYLMVGRWQGVCLQKHI